jgi:ferritin-like metal-binding protein YciE
MAKAAQSDELKEAFTSHLEETEQHVTKLEKVFESIGSTARAKKCPAIEGIVEEGEELIKEFKQTHACDAALIAAGQKAEHYEIASYGTLLCFARQMGHGEAENLLNSILEQEKAADTKLNEIATTSANEMAMQA